MYLVAFIHRVAKNSTVSAEWTIFLGGSGFCRVVLGLVGLYSKGYLSLQGRTTLGTEFTVFFVLKHEGKDLGNTCNGVHSKNLAPDV